MVYSVVNPLDRTRGNTWHLLKVAGGSPGLPAWTNPLLLGGPPTQDLDSVPLPQACNGDIHGGRTCKSHYEP